MRCAAAIRSYRRGSACQAGAAAGEVRREHQHEERRVELHPAVQQAQASLDRHDRDADRGQLQRQRDRNAIRSTSIVAARSGRDRRDGRRLPAAAPEQLERRQSCSTSGSALRRLRAVNCSERMPVDADQDHEERISGAVSNITAPESRSIGKTNSKMLSGSSSAKASCGGTRGSERPGPRCLQRGGGQLARTLAARVRRAERQQWSRNSAAARFDPRGAARHPPSPARRPGPATPTSASSRCYLAQPVAAQEDG